VAGKSVALGRTIERDRRTKRLMSWRLLHPSDYRRMRWKNDGGWTTELAKSPDNDSGAFDWRISIADIETSGPFSTFVGCDRIIGLLEGIGMELRFDSAEAVRLERRLQFTRFAGERQTEGILISGAVRDFNVIVKRDAFDADVLHRPLVGPMVFFRDTTWFIYLAGGQADAKCGGERCTLDAGASLLLSPQAGAERVVLNGGGEVVLVKFVPKNATQAN
jgi:environmental stress-induced protein Ves